MFIAPVKDLLEEAEVIIVPDRRLYKVPFAALSEKEEAVARCKKGSGDGRTTSGCSAPGRRESNEAGGT